MIKICVITEGIKTYTPVIKKKKKEVWYDNIVGRIWISIEALISMALLDSNISHD